MGLSWAERAQSAHSCSDPIATVPHGQPGDPHAFPRILLLGIFPFDGDAPALAWEDSFAIEVTAAPELVDTAFAGSVAVSAGSLTYGFGQSTRTTAYVRARNRGTGVELWRRDFEEENALGVTTNDAGTLIYALLRTTPEFPDDGAERLVVLAASTGATLFEDESPLLFSDAFAFSELDSLVVSPSGLTLYRLEFQETTEELRLIAYDATTGEERWSETRSGQDSYRRPDAPGMNTSLSVAPDSSAVYVTFTEEPFFQEFDATLARYSAVSARSIGPARSQRPTKRIGVRLPLP